MSVILGINTFHAGAAAAVVVDGQPVAAIAEERLNRVKYYANFPKLAIARCLEMTGLQFRDIDAIAVGRNAGANLGAKARYALANPSRLAGLVKIKRARQQMDDLKTLVARECQVDPAELRFVEYHIEHHLAHVASAYFISPWERSAGFSMDGSGDFVTTMLADCDGPDIHVKRRVHVPHSLGSLYSMLCEFVGYAQYGDEGKVMGLAPYGSDRFVDQIAAMVRMQDGSFTLDPKYFVAFGEHQGVSINDDGEMVLGRHYTDRVVELFGAPRQANAEIQPRDQDIAFALQRVFEQVYFHMLNALAAMVPGTRIAMAGGCVLNSVANGKLFDRTRFTETCIQPAAGDDGLALGAALYVSNAILREGHRFAMENAYLGPEFHESEIRRALEAAGIPFVRLDRQRLIEETVNDLAAGNVVGWFQGRMEWGPRALGNRSILAHPGLPNMKDLLNARIKRREWFRPFAPAVLAERQADIFEKAHPSPFMLHVYEIKTEWRERLCAVNHVDNTGRLQSVRRDENPIYYDLIKAFGERTGIPVLINTSFNENEPIVCTPAEAVQCFQRTKMDTLAIGPFLCRKANASA